MRSIVFALVVLLAPMTVRGDVFVNVDVHVNNKAKTVAVPPNVEEMDFGGRLSMMVKAKGKLELKDDHFWLVNRVGVHRVRANWIVTSKKLKAQVGENVVISGTMSLMKDEDGKILGLQISPLDLDPLKD